MTWREIAILFTSSSLKSIHLDKCITSHNSMPTKSPVYLNTRIIYKPNSNDVKERSIRLNLHTPISRKQRTFPTIRHTHPPTHTHTCAVYCESINRNLPSARFYRRNSFNSAITAPHCNWRHAESQHRYIIQCNTIAVCSRSNTYWTQNLYHRRCVIISHLCYYY